EDGIRDFHVTGVQTCALPIFPAACRGFQISLLTPPVMAFMFILAANSRIRFRVDAGNIAYSFSCATLALYDRMKLLCITLSTVRSEERRVGKEWMFWMWLCCC